MLQGVAGFIGFLICCLLAPQAMSQTAVVPDTVFAKPGEGIFSLLRRCERSPSACLAEFIALNKASLGSDSSLLKDRAYLLPPKAADSSQAVVQKAAALSEPEQLQASAKEPVATNTPKADKPAAPAKETTKPSRLQEPLFGKKYEEVTINDRQLEGAVYYLLAGHGGPDPGAIGKYGPYQLSEDEYAYDVTLRLAHRLMEHGATVYMIVRDENDGIRDETILRMDTDELHFPDKEIPYSQKYRLRHRVAAVNELFLKHAGAYQRLLAIHIDSRSRGENIDVFFYHHENSPDGKALAESIHNTFTRKYSRHQPNRAYHGSVSTRSSLYVVKYSHPPAVFVELGNIRNQRDQRRFVLPDNRQALANWLAEGILEAKKD